MNTEKDYAEYIIKLWEDDLLLTNEHFELILGQVLNEITKGKGYQRHGKGTEFSQQPWKYITDGVGTGFPIGQAIKKLIEIKAYHERPNPTVKDMIAWKREALGAIVYVVMSIIWTENQYITTNKYDIQSGTDSNKENI